MGVQQASLDFFNLPPEEPKPLEKLVQPAKEKNPEPPGIDGETINVDALTPDAPAEEADTAVEYLAEARAEIPEPIAPLEEIVVDQQVRELSFVVRQNKPAPAEVVNGRKSTRGRIRLSDMDNLVDLVDVPTDEILFQKRYYSIGAVSDMFKVNISLIRFWENEFDILKPKKNAKGDRLFRPEDIKNLQLIYHLLREKKYTIDGAKEFLKNNKKAEESFTVIESLKKIKSFLLELKANL